MQFNNLNFTIDKSQLPTYQTVNGSWKWTDYWGGIKVRFAFSRYQYKVLPGLYAMGKPGVESDVFVTSNYKLTFDILRRELEGLNAWILVLDTKGINVWCAAGKGTFGTIELINRIRITKLNQVVSHKRLIVPQLGAVGIAAHEVRNATGFRISYGPVKASDIKEFVANSYKANSEMRTIRFNLKDRTILTPVEIVMSLKYLGIAILAFAVFCGIEPNGFSFINILREGWKAGLFLMASYFSGTFLTPAFLPIIPGRAFATKGAFMGLLVFCALLFLRILPGSWISIAAWMCVFISVSSYLGMNFTGASTYTSITGVEKEMKIALPIQIGMAAAGIILFVISQFI